MIILFASDQIYAELDFLLTMRAAWINSACHFDLCRVPEGEKRSTLAMLDMELKQMFEELTR